MKRKIAFKKHKNGCIICDKTLKKGDVYYLERIVYECEHDESIIGYTLKKCARCQYEESEHQRRFDKFKLNCKHPDKFQEVIWNIISGEAVSQPDHLYCRLCRKGMK